MSRGDCLKCHKNLKIPLAASVDSHSSTSFTERHHFLEGNFLFLLKPNEQQKLSASLSVHVAHQKHTWAVLELPRGICWQTQITSRGRTGEKHTHSPKGQHVCVRQLGADDFSNAPSAQRLQDLRVPWLSCSDSDGGCAACEWHRSLTTDATVSSEGRLASSVPFWSPSPPFQSRAGVWKWGWKGDICSPRLPLTLLHTHLAHPLISRNSLQPIQPPETTKAFTTTHSSLFSWVV